MSPIPLFYAVSRPVIMLKLSFFVNYLLKNAFIEVVTDLYHSEVTPPGVAVCLVRAQRKLTSCFTFIKVFKAALPKETRQE